MSELARLRKAMAAIARIANDATRAADHDDPDHPDDREPDPGSDRREEEDGTGYVPELSCVPRSLPERLLIRAAATAREINPINAPFASAPRAGVTMDDGANGVQEPMRIAVLTSKYWGPTPRRLTVSFMESTPANLRARIVSHLNAWSQTGCITFAETGGVGDVRISRRRGGYWSYLGTDVLLIPRNRPTMNLEAFTMSTPESEYRRVVRHEAGHTLGFPHEHMRASLVARVDRNKAYDYFLRTQGWDRQTVDEQVLTSLAERSLLSTPSDQTSIMCYQLPASITRDARPILGGLDINRSDFDFVARIYPKPRPVRTTTVRAPRYAPPDDAEPQEPSFKPADWPESEDVEVPV
jgi:hypothetical protein